tara:strand:- start:132 stop:497 length:366 start_codon:yes stop_codon:yes gene_type:complete
MVQLSTYKTTTESITVASTSADASATLLYTCPAKHSATIDFLHISNNNAGAKKANIQFYNTTGTAYHNIIKAHSIAANSSYNVLDNSQMHLQAGDQILVYAETTNTLEATISVKEYYNPNR